MDRLADTRTSPSRIRLVIANLPVMLCDLLKGALRAIPDIYLLEPANDVRHLLDISKADAADVILLGSARQENNIASAIIIMESLPERYAKSRVIVLTQNSDYAEVIALFRSGVRGLLNSADLNFDLLCKSIRCVHQGEIWANNEQLVYLVSSLAHPRSSEVTDSYGKPLLTTREQQVLHLLAEGLSNYELAKELKLSEHTIKNHLFRIYDKLGVSTRMEAVLYALTPRKTRRVASIEEHSSKIRAVKAS
jgi:two-component system, NarL family, response regulator DegU